MGESQHASQRFSGCGVSSVPDSWPALSFLESLRPGSGESVELALLTSYSADLGSIGATLLALVGKDTDEGKGSPSDLADAVERLRGKVRIIIQRGRLAKMHRTPRIAAVLDQFVREVDFDEATHSWHAKAALIQTRTTLGDIEWRLWIGSRNLTECMNRDIGLLLVSDKKGGATIRGADELARALAKKASLEIIRANSLAAIIASVTWRAPPGIRVQQIRWSSGIGGQTFPLPPTGTDEIVVVSPFVDENFLALQTSTGKRAVRRTLLSTMREIERVGPSLAAFDNLLALDAPDYPSADPELGPYSGVQPAEPDRVDRAEEEVGGGLHAKLLFVRSGQRRTLWLGSANATMRAWTGRNVEVVVELLITEAIERGLKALLGAARIVDPSQIEHSPELADLEETALERARAQVAARWAAELNIDDGEMWIRHCSDTFLNGPHPDQPDITLQVGTLHGDLLVWGPQQITVNLGPAVLAEQSEFVRLRVSRGNKGIAWLQRATAKPPFGEDRDRAAFVRFLGAKGFLLWLARLLADNEGQSPGDWTNDEPRERVSEAISWVDSSLPTLEEILAAWARDPANFREIERRVSQYLPAVLEQTQGEDSQTREILRNFCDLWSKVRVGLSVGKGRR